MLNPIQSRGQTMATTFVIACPECSKQVRVSDEHVGKKIRCKACGNVFPVSAPGADAPPAPAPKTQAAAPGAAKTKTAPSGGPKTKAAPPGRALRPDEDPNSPEYDPNKYILAQTNDTLPRCPFCAKEMPSAEALICLNCGYNTRTRTRPFVQQVYAPTATEWFLWWLPAILTILAMIGMVVWYLFFWGLIEGWLEDSWFEDEKGPPTTYIAAASPSMFRVYHALLIAFLYVPMVRFVHKRLVKNPRPPERKIKEDLY
jgi:predicted Zn finger-like uncharacterized protein